MSFMQRYSAPSTTQFIAVDGVGEDDPAKDPELFKKYEMMMKLGISVYGAVGRMRQDGMDKADIAAFEKKHCGL